VQRCCPRHHHGLDEGDRISRSARACISRVHSGLRYRSQQPRCRRTSPSCEALGESSPRSLSRLCTMREYPHWRKGKGVCFLLSHLARRFTTLVILGQNPGKEGTDVVVEKCIQSSRIGIVRATADLPRNHLFARELQLPR
jgi:hypothetical protein